MTWCVTDANLVDDRPRRAAGRKHAHELQRDEIGKTGLRADRNVGSAREMPVGAGDQNANLAQLVCISSTCGETLAANIGRWPA